MLCVSQAWSSGGGVERTPRTKDSDEVVGADGVGAGGGIGAITAGADTEALVSETGTAADLGPHGTRLKNCMISSSFHLVRFCATNSSTPHAIKLSYTPG